MHLVRIEASRRDLGALLELADVHVVAPSAIDRGDGTWLVSAYVTDAGADAIRGRGLTIHPVKDARQVRDEWAAAARQAPTRAAADRPSGYLDSASIAHRLEALAGAHADVCVLDVLAHRTHEGRDVPYLRIGSGGATVVVIGGVHAREWAPPDSLLSLAEGLVRAYGEGAAFEHPAWQDPSSDPPVEYAAWSLAAERVKRVVETATLVVVPLVNPDGRDFSLAPLDAGAPDAELHRMWRKNRRPADAGNTGPWCRGVDLNRNFDIAWDFERYYSPAAAREVQSSKDPCDQQIYIGPSAASEPETQNVQTLVSELRPACFMDVHSYARDILYPWGMDDDQGRDPEESFRNPDWDRGGPHGGRDGAGGSYGEFLPRDLAASHQAVARRMRDAIRDQAGRDPIARRRSIYSVKQALGLYPTTGTSDDYCTSVAMLQDGHAAMHAFCLECGIDQAPADPFDNEGGFHPDYETKFPKIEREVHAAVLALVEAAIAGPG